MILQPEVVGEGSTVVIGDTIEVNEGVKPKEVGDRVEPGVNVPDGTVREGVAVPVEVFSGRTGVQVFGGVDDAK